VPLPPKEEISTNETKGESKGGLGKKREEEGTSIERGILIREVVNPRAIVKGIPNVHTLTRGAVDA